MNKEEVSLSLNPIYNDKRLWGFGANVDVKMTTGWAKAFSKGPQVVDPYFTEDELNYHTHFSDAMEYLLEHQKIQEDTIDIPHEVIDEQVYNDCLCLTAGKFDAPPHDLEGK